MDNNLELDMTLPCLYCGSPVSVTSTHVACDKEECRDKESVAYEE